MTHDILGHLVLRLSIDSQDLTNATIAKLLREHADWMESRDYLYPLGN